LSKGDGSGWMGMTKAGRQQGRPQKEKATTEDGTIAQTLGCGGLDFDGGGSRASTGTKGAAAHARRSRSQRGMRTQASSGRQLWMIGGGKEDDTSHQRTSVEADGDHTKRLTVHTLTHTQKGNDQGLGAQHMSRPRGGRAPGENMERRAAKRGGQRCGAERSKPERGWVGGEGFRESVLGAEHRCEEHGRDDTMATRVQCG
jgi:hypothetical protein